ncbi:unnamed protein product [Urochloa humidicola]
MAHEPAAAQLRPRKLERRSRPGPGAQRRRFAKLSRLAVSLHAAAARLHPTGASKRRTLAPPRQRARPAGRLLLASPLHCWRVHAAPHYYFPDSLLSAEPPRERSSFSGVGFGFHRA